MESAILLVDDEPHVLSALTRSLYEEPYEVLSELSGEMALATMRKHTVKVVISDEKMARMSGSQFLAQAREEFPHTVRIMLTGHATLEAAMRAVNEGEIYRFFSKPWDDTVIRFAIRSAIEKYDLEEENRRLLATVREQAIEIRTLEKRYPGISQVERDEAGNLLVSEISDEEMGELLVECEQRYGIDLSDRTA